MQKRTTKRGGVLVFARTPDRYAIVFQHRRNQTFAHRFRQLPMLSRLVFQGRYIKSPYRPRQCWTSRGLGIVQALGRALCTQRRHRRRAHGLGMRRLPRCTSRTQPSPQLDAERQLRASAQAVGHGASTLLPECATVLCTHATSTHVRTHQ